nr:immunoglobulin heavy chain junction region [Mus musculus]
CARMDYDDYYAMDYW